MSTANSRGSDSISSGPYLEALYEFWRGSPAAALECATKTLVDEPDHPQMFQLYRLWIEALAVERAVPALRSLKEHLLMRGGEGGEEQISFLALRGLVHLELDEVQAAHLICRTVAKVKHNSYCQELALAVQARGPSKELTGLAGWEGKLSDYFQMQTLAKALVARGREGQLQTLLERVRGVFPGSPMPNYFEMHLSFDAGDYETAAVRANALCTDFPENNDFNFFAGFTAFKRNDFEGARRRFEKALSAAGENDPDVVAMIAHAYRELARRQNGNVQFKEKATSYFKRAMSLFKGHGLPVATAALRLNSLEDEAQANAESALHGFSLKSAGDGALQEMNGEDLAPTRMWLIKVSPRRYHELTHSKERELEFLTRPMGGAARPGDLCFFAADESSFAAGDRRAHARRWRIAAIYAVISEPMWHPLHRYETALQLVSLPPEPIPVDVSQLDTEARTSKTKLAKDHPYRFGVFELEEGALDIITEAVAQRRKGAGDEMRGLEEEVVRLRRPS